jgi:signal transduction histidine kinase
MGFAELLELGRYGPLSDKQQASIGEIHDSAKDLMNMINDLLAEAQLEAGTLKLNIAPFTPADLKNDVLPKMRVLAENKGLTLTGDIAADMPPTLLGDQPRLRQILFNLIGNAIKFTEQGAVHVHIYRHDTTHWAIQVTDTGLGILAEARSYIFEPFRQVDGSATREHVGSGLGLSIVKQLVTLMGGQITLSSQVGHGSAFTVILPLNPTQESPMARGVNLYNVQQTESLHTLPRHTHSTKRSISQESDSPKGTTTIMKQR